MAVETGRPCACVQNAGARGLGQHRGARRRTLGALATGALLFVSGAVVSADDQGQPRLPTIVLSVGEHELIVEVASTSQQRYDGLSFRTQLGDDEGMLFVYRQPRMLTFTMRNTLLPLSIAYIDADLVINEILDMDVGPGQLFPSQGLVQYALEVRKGWFEERGITAGTKVSLR